MAVSAAIGLKNIVEDTTPQLGGNLDAQSNDLTALGDVRFTTAKAIQTAQSAGNTLLIQAYDVDGGTYTTMATLTANNTPTMDLASGVTIGGNAILDATSTSSVLTSVGTITSGVWNGTDIAVADGGTGLSSTTAYAVLCGGTTGTGALQSIAGVGTSGQVLTSNGAGALPTFQAAGGGGAPTGAQYVTLATDATLTDERVLTGTANQITITDGGAGTTVTLATPQDIGTASSVTFGNVTMAAAGALRTGTTATDTLLLQAYDNDTGPAYVTFGTLTAGNTPTFDLSTSVTMGTNAIYYATGTDVPVTDGGTGLSSTTAYAVLCGGTTGTGALQSIAGVGTSGQVLTSNGAGALPTFQAAGAGSPAGADTQIQFNNSGSFGASANFTWDDNTLLVKNTTDNLIVQVLALHGDRATPATADEAYTSLMLSNSAGTQKEFSRITWGGNDITASSEEGIFAIDTMIAGGLTRSFTITGGNAVFEFDVDIGGTTSLGGAMVEVPIVLTDAATIAVDASDGNVFDVTLGGNRTMGNPSNSRDGQKIVFRVRQDGTGSRTLTMGANYRFGTDITGITLTTGINKTDYIGCIYNKADFKWDIVSFVKGY